jgi:hypothetical protein
MVMEAIAYASRLARYDAGTRSTSEAVRFRSGGEGIDARCRWASKRRPSI